MKKAEVILEYQNIILDPPVSPAALYQQSCSNDAVTINSWRDIWIRNAKENHRKHGPFKERSLGKLWGIYKNTPCIIAGSGPSLKGNAAQLKNRKGLPLVSCLHNFHYFEDLGLEPEFYVTLDAGPVTIEEVSEGGAKSEEEYWSMTKNRKLLAFIATDPKLIDKWQGEIYWYTCPVPDPVYQKEIGEIEDFHTYVSNGGNVFGASLYISRGIFGACPIIFMGADFSFSYDHKFHAWDSKYDKTLGHTVPMVDVYGIRKKTWRSYANFKGWFDSVALRVPGIWINCTEGGCFGSYPEGNLVAIRQMDLAHCLEMYSLHEHLLDQCVNNIDDKKILF